VQECNCSASRHSHAQCPDPSLRFPDHVDPNLTPGDLLADDWEIDESDKLRDPIYTVVFKYLTEKRPEKVLDVEHYCRLAHSISNQIAAHAQKETNEFIERHRLNPHGKK